jgi:hypothetical protein
MNILFIDDTEQLSKTYIGVGGVILRDDTLSNLYSLFTSKKEAHGIPSQEEIKWHPPQNSWLRQNLKDEDRISAYSDILDLIGSFNGKIIVAVLRRDNPAQNIVDDKWKCIEFVTERFQYFLQEQDDKDGIIIADYPSSNVENKELLGRYYQLLANGTRYVKPNNIVMNLLTTQSHLNPALQLADLVVAIATGMCTPHNQYALPYWDIVKRNLHCNKNGEIMGCGLKVFPREMVDELMKALFPETIKEREDVGMSYAEYIENQRYIYSVIMSEEELDMHFPRP